MATHIVSWGGNDNIVSPVLSSRSSIVSIDSILPLAHKRMTTSAFQGSLNKRMSSLSAEPSGSETLTPPSTYQSAFPASDSFIRHGKYFLKDGNVAFLVDGILYCVHRYFFSRDSVYFSTRFDQLSIRDHEALPITISLGSDVEREDFDAFLSTLYPENFGQHDLSYKEWKSVLHLSTRWDFASIRRLALNNIQPPTPHDRLVLARTYSINDWVVPALSELCERRSPLTLDEARQMDIEDVVLVATVREDIRNHALQVDGAEILRPMEAAQAGKLVPPAVPTSRAVEHGSLLTGQKRASNGYESDGEAMEASGAISEDKHSRAQTASTTAVAPSRCQVLGDEADVITNTQSTHDAVEATLTTDKAAPGTSGVKSTSVSNEVDTVPTQGTTPAKAVSEPELREDPAPRRPPADDSASPPVPEEGTAVTNKPAPTSEETSASPSQTAEPAPTKVEDADKTEEPSAQPTEPEALAPKNADTSKPDAVEECPKPQSGIDDNNCAVDERPAMQDGDGRADDATKLTLRVDCVRGLSTVPIRTASSTSGTPAEEVAPSAVDEEGGAPERSSISDEKRRRMEKNKRRSEKRKLNKLKSKGEKNVPQPPSGETMSNADNSTVQDHNPPVVTTTTPVKFPSGEGEGELVEKAESGEEGGWMDWQDWQ